MKTNLTTLTAFERRDFFKRVALGAAALAAASPTLPPFGDGAFAAEKTADIWAPWSPNGSESAPKINVKIDVSDAPDALDWAKKARLILISRHPQIVEALDGPEGVANLDPNFEIRLIFKSTDGVAFSSGSTITVSSRWIEKNPNDFGLIVHEAAHVAQAYGYVGGETWATEGIADYVRYYIVEKNVADSRVKTDWRIDPKRSNYTDGYGITATFFDWLIREKDPDFLKKLHRALRSKKRGADFCAEEYQTTPDALWNEFIASL